MLATGWPVTVGRPRVRATAVAPRLNAEPKPQVSANESYALANCGRAGPSDMSQSNAAKLVVKARTSPPNALVLRIR
jgi:hypothetical protein